VLDQQGDIAKVGWAEMSFIFARLAYGTASLRAAEVMDHARKFLDSALLTGTEDGFGSTGCAGSSLDA
jgi:hypothetical protein